MVCVCMFVCIYGCMSDVKWIFVCGVYKRLFLCFPCLVSMMYGVWCMVYGVLCVVYGVLCVVYVVWCLGVWCMFHSA